MNGLFGNPANWDAIKEALEKVVDMQQTLLVVSHANSLRQVSPWPTLDLHPYLMS